MNEKEREVRDRQTETERQRCETEMIEREVGGTDRVRETERRETHREARKIFILSVSVA